MCKVLKKILLFIFFTLFVTQISNAETVKVFDFTKDEMKILQVKKNKRTN